MVVQESERRWLQKAEGIDLGHGPLVGGGTFPPPGLRKKEEIDARAYGVALVG